MKHTYILIIMIASAVANAQNRATISDTTFDVASWSTTMSDFTGRSYDRFVGGGLSGNGLYVSMTGFGFGATRYDLRHFKVDRTFSPSLGKAVMFHRELWQFVSTSNNSYQQTQFIVSQGSGVYASQYVWEPQIPGTTWQKAPSGAGKLIESPSSYARIGGSGQLFWTCPRAHHPSASGGGASTLEFRLQRSSATPFSSWTLTTIRGLQSRGPSRFETTADPAPCRRSSWTSCPEMAECPWPLGH